MSKTKDVGARDLVLKLFLGENRPYSINDVTQKVPEDYGKATVQKAIDQLLENGKLIEKTYGKQKVYAANQTLLPTLSEQELREMDVKIATLTANSKADEEAMKYAEADLKSLAGKLSIAEARKEFETESEQVKSLEERLESLSVSTVKVSQSDRDRVMRQYNAMLKEWRRRKRLCMDIVDAVLEGYPKTKTALLEDAGIETDESVGVSIPK